MKSLVCLRALLLLLALITPVAAMELQECSCPATTPVIDRTGWCTESVGISSKSNGQSYIPGVCASENCYWNGVTIYVQPPCSTTPSSVRVLSDRKTWTGGTLSWNLGTIYAACGIPVGLHIWYYDDESSSEPVEYAHASANCDV